MSSPAAPPHPRTQDTFFGAHAPSRRQIGEALRALRRKRGLTQGELARILAVSQGNLSEIESGKASLSAEQFLVLLKFFNVPATFFEPAATDADGTLQKALAAHGATHLVEDPGLLPSERLAHVETVIREVLVEGGPARSLTALAPILLQNLDRINFTRLHARIRDLDLERRYLWLLDNVLEAIRIERGTSTDRKVGLALTRAGNTLERHRDVASRKVPCLPDEPVGILEEDCLDHVYASTRSMEEVRRHASAISRTWLILTPLLPADFVHAIRESRPVDAH